MRERQRRAQRPNAAGVTARELTANKACHRRGQSAGSRKWTSRQAWRLDGGSSSAVADSAKRYVGRVQARKLPAQRSAKRQDGQDQPRQGLWVARLGKLSAVSRGTSRARLCQPLLWRQVATPHLAAVNHETGNTRTPQRGSVASRSRKAEG
jgi:hypothetical protein